MLRAVIFDIDGTLIDSVDLHAQAWQEALAHFGFDAPFEEVRNQIGKGGDKLVPVFVPAHVPEERRQEISDYRSELFKRKYLPQVRPFAGVRELFERVRDEGLRIALASSAKADELEAYVKLLGVGELVEQDTSKDDVAHSKPDPDVFVAALEKLSGVRTDEAIAVGDTPYDAQAARAAGMSVIGVLTGGWREEQLREAGCCAVYRGPAELLAVFDRSPLSVRKEAA